MADINVERKRPSLWPWIIGLILLVALIYAAARVLGRDQPQTGTQIETTL
jgi:hypothetical protein